MSKRAWKVGLLGLTWLVGCAKHEDANALPACDAPEVQESARKAAAESVKIPFTLSTFSEVESESSAKQRACRVRAKHAASGAAIWMRFTLARRLVEAKDQAKDMAKDKAKEPREELAVVFAPIE